jgi:hypothetical protein
MSSDKDSIRTAFLEGTQTVYSILFSDTVVLQLLDEKGTQVNDLYKETKKKVYKDPIQLLGKISSTIEKQEDADQGSVETLTVKIPAKELIDKAVPHSVNDIPTLRKARITYGGKHYYVDKVNCQTNIEDVYLFYEFIARDRSF